MGFFREELRDAAGFDFLVVFVEPFDHPRLVCGLDVRLRQTAKRSNDLSNHKLPFIDVGKCVGYALKKRTKEEKQMSFFEKSGEIMQNWDKNEFRKLFHKDFMFIREFEMVTLEDHIKNIDVFMTEQDRTKMMAERRRTSLIHENRFVTEVRWEEGGEIVTNVFLKKEGLVWRSIVNREREPA